MSRDKRYKHKVSLNLRKYQLQLLQECCRIEGKDMNAVVRQFLEDGFAKYFAEKEMKAFYDNCLKKRDDVRQLSLLDNKK